MNWLLHNVVADLYGPYFLLFYAIAIGAMIVACYKSVRVGSTGRETWSHRKSRPSSTPTRSPTCAVARMR